VRLAELTTEETRALLAAPQHAVLVPVGSVEPHGPHLPLATDTLLSEEAAARAVPLLAARGVRAVIAPSVSYGVTDFAVGFAGAIGVPAPILTAFLRAVAMRFLADGFRHVCLVNNHLEPAHDAAVRAAIEGLAPGRASVACPLTRRWGRTLTEEYKRGNCHAGRYETSLVLAAGGRVLEEVAKELPEIGTSLADGIGAGKTTFAAMGLHRAYAGAPAAATKAEGDATFGKLAEMIAAEVLEALAVLEGPPT
jgi:creatinine amidohydrolase